MAGGSNADSSAAATLRPSTISHTPPPISELVRPRRRWASRLPAVRRCCHCPPSRPTAPEWLPSLMCLSGMCGRAVMSAQAKREQDSETGRSRAHNTSGRRAYAGGESHMRSAPSPPSLPQAEALCGGLWVLMTFRMPHPSSASPSDIFDPGQAERGRRRRRQPSSQEQLLKSGRQEAGTHAWGGAPSNDSHQGIYRRARKLASALDRSNARGQACLSAAARSQALVRRSFVARLVCSKT